MKSPPCYAILLLALAGCSFEERIRLSKDSSPNQEVERIAATLPKEKAAEFRSAAKVLMMVAGLESGTSEHMKARIESAINGKTPSQVIADYEALPHDTKINAANMLKYSDSLFERIEQFKQSEAAKN